MLRGYTSKYWALAQKSIVGDQLPLGKTNWHWQLVKHTIDLHRNIWTDHNNFVKGKDKKKAMEKARQSIIQRVRSLYQKPPCLAQWYPTVTSVSLEDCLRKPTKYLSDWLHWISHQIRMTDYINKTRPPPLPGTAHDSSGLCKCTAAAYINPLIPTMIINRDGFPIRATP